MAYQHDRKDRRLQRPSDFDAVLSIIGFPGLCDLGSLLSPETKGRRQFPDLLLFALVAATSVTASQQSMLQMLNSLEHWPRVLEAYRTTTGIELSAPRPPSAAVLDSFVRDLANNTQRREAVRDLLGQVSRGLAWSLGYLHPNVTPDQAHPNRKHMIVGDGTWLAPASTVKPQLDRTTGVTTYLGSQATIYPPRVQDRETRNDPNKQSMSGVNQVIISTPTHNGSLWLAVDQAFGGESLTATALLDEVLDRFDNGVHLIAWDGAITGRDVERYQARGVHVQNKGVARKGTDRGGHAKYEAKIISAEDAIALCQGKASLAEHAPGRRLPLGTSVYAPSRPSLPTASKEGGASWLHGGLPRTEVLPALPADAGAAGEPTEHELRARPQMVRGKYWKIDPATLRNHEGPRGCTHTYWLDDEVIVACERHTDHHWYKVGMAVATRSRTLRQRDGYYDWHTDWQLTCPLGDHTFSTVSRPRPGRADNDLGDQLAWATLRPLARAHGEAWSVTAHLRNTAESTNAWFKRCFTLVGSARARRLRTPEQHVDLLGAWLYRISDVYRVGLVRGDFS